MPNSSDDLSLCQRSCQLLRLPAAALRKGKLRLPLEPQLTVAHRFRVTDQKQMQYSDPRAAAAVEANPDLILLLRPTTGLALKDPYVWYSDEGLGQPAQAGLWVVLYVPGVVPAAFTGGAVLLSANGPRRSCFFGGHRQASSSRN